MEHKSEQEPKPEKKQTRAPKNKLVLNISQTKYDVLKDVARKLKFKISTDKETQEFDLFWTDMAVQPE